MFSKFQIKLSNSYHYQVNKATYLINAAIRNNVQQLQELLESPKWFYSIRDLDGNSLLHIAIINKNVEVFDFLLSLDDFPLEQVNAKGHTPLVTALTTNTGYHSLIDRGEHFALKLLKRGVAAPRISTIPNRYVDVGDTLLHCALGRGYVEVAHLLIEMGADVNAQNDEGEPPLLKCFHRPEHLHEQIAMLLYYGADPTIRGSYGYNTFDCVVGGCYDSSPEDVYMQRNLFFYVFDQYTQYEMSCNTLIGMGETLRRSFILDELSLFTFNGFRKFKYFGRKF